MFFFSDETWDDYGEEVYEPVYDGEEEEEYYFQENMDGIRNRGLTKLL
jgi:hypothetical protein